MGSTIISITKSKQCFLHPIYGLSWDIHENTITHALNGDITLCGKKVSGKNKGWLRGLDEEVNCKACLKKIERYN